MNILSKIIINTIIKICKLYHNIMTNKTNNDDDIADNTR